MNIHYFQHVPFEGLGVIEDWLKTNAITPTATKFFENNSLPNEEDVDALIVMGGPMGVYDTDKFSWLLPEKEFIQKIIEANKPVLGICLGAQFIASALGAKVYKGTREIGWYPIEKIRGGTYFGALPDELTVLHWHGDTFDLPEGALRLAQTSATPNQAFEYKNTLALQFHFEMGPQHVVTMVEKCADELDGSQYVQTAEEILVNNGHFETNRRIMFGILDQLFLNKPSI